jgi:hypothetical protein
MIAPWVTKIQKTIFLLLFSENHIFVVVCEVILIENLTSAKSVRISAVLRSLAPAVYRPMLEKP